MRWVSLLAWISVLPFRAEAFSRDPRENLWAARWTFYLTSAGSAALSVAASWTGSSWIPFVSLALLFPYSAYVLRILRALGREIDEEVVRDVMES